MIQFERETWSDLEAALRRAWLETNVLGGFASSTIIGLNTRRYHGLRCLPWRSQRNEEFGSRSDRHSRAAF